MIVIAFVLGFIIGCNFRPRPSLRGAYSPAPVCRLEPSCRPSVIGTVSPLDDGKGLPKTIPNLQSGVIPGK